MAVCIYVVECKIQWENFHSVTFACYWKDPVREAIEVKQQPRTRTTTKTNSKRWKWNPVIESIARTVNQERENKKGNLSHKNPYNETKFIEQLIEMLYLLEQLSRTLLNFSTFVLYSIFLCRRFCFSPYLIEFKFRSDSFFIPFFIEFCSLHLQTWWNRDLFH